MSTDDIPWNRFNAVIVTRHSIPELYQKSGSILSKIPYPKVLIPSANTIASLYVHQCLTAFPQYDWVINVDDDCFLTDIHAIYELLDYMQQNDYDYCGMPDGLTYTPRDIFNPASMNPFFNIFRTKTIWRKITPDTMQVRYHPSLLEKVDMQMLHPEIVGCNHSNIYKYNFQTNYEPFYTQFFALLAQTNALFLYGESYRLKKDGSREGVLFPEDPWTTILYTHTKKPFALHTWFARDYYGSTNPYTPPQNKERIDRIADHALASVV
jgi:hypothetical protein